jgi:hypothetical protein
MRSQSATKNTKRGAVNRAEVCREALQLYMHRLRFLFAAFLPALFAFLDWGLSEEVFKVFSPLGVEASPQAMEELSSGEAAHRGARGRKKLGIDLSIPFRYSKVRA